MTRLERRARRLARHVPRPHRARYREEILGHLEDLAAEARARGRAPRAAVAEAIARFGDGSKTATDIGRAARGRPVVLFPSRVQSWLASFLIYDLKALLIVLVLVVFVRWKVLGAYHIPTPSMEPTLMGEKWGGDRILVDILTHRTLRDLGLTSGEIARWNVLVFRNDHDDGQNYIKRVGGLPGERLGIAGGDIFVNGAVARKDDATRDSMMIDLIRPFAADDPKSAFDHWEPLAGSWNPRGRRLLATAGENGGGPAILRASRELRNGYFDHDDEYVAGSHDIVDGRFSCDVEWQEGEGGEVRLSFGRSNQILELRVPGPGAEGPATLSFDGELVASDGGWQLETFEESRLTISRIDGVLQARRNGRLMFEHETDWDLATAIDLGRAPARAQIEVRGGAATVRTLHVERDIHYVVTGSNQLDGIETGEYVVPDGTLIMLGDNSANSSDSRRFGPFPVDCVIGKPLIVFWPPNRWGAVR